MARTFSLSRWARRMGAGMVALYVLGAVALVFVIGALGMGLMRLLGAPPANGSGYSKPRTDGSMTRPEIGWVPPDWVGDIPETARDVRDWWFGVLNSFK